MKHKEIVEFVENELKSRRYVSVSHSLIANPQEAEKAVEELSRKYHVKVTYFVESWKGCGGIQYLCVSKDELQHSNARLIYDKIYS